LISDCSMQLSGLLCHGSGRGLRQAAGRGSAFRPEPRQAIRQLMRGMLDVFWEA